MTTRPGSRVNGARELLVAIESNDRSTAELLLNEGVSVNGGLNLGTPLCRAIRMSSLAWVRLLVSQGCDVNLRDVSDESPLCVALQFDQQDIATFLIQQGCNVNRETPGERLPPVSLAIVKNNTKTAELLIHAGCDTDKQDKCGRTPLHYATMYRNHSIAEQLIHVGCKVNVRCRTSEGFTPLHIAARSGDLTAVSLIMSLEDRHVLPSNHRIVDVNKPSNCQGLTPLHLAAANGSTEVVRELVRRGANVRALDASGVTPLVSCILSEQEKRFEVAEALLSNLSEILCVNLRQSTGRACLPLTSYPVCMAVRQGDGRMLEMLIEHNRRIRSMAGKSGLQGSRQNVVDSVNDVAVACHRQAESSNLVLACLHDERSILLLDRLLTAADCGDVSLDAGPWKCLSAAAEKWPWAMQKLTRFGLNVRATADNSGGTILHQPKCLLNPQSVAALLDLGASPSWMHSLRRTTPLHVLAARNDGVSRDDDIECDTASLLLDYGADVNARDAEGETPVLLAIRNGRWRLAFQLLANGARIHPFDVGDSARLSEKLAERLTTIGNIDYFRRSVEEALSDRVIPLKHCCRKAIVSRLISCGSLPLTACVKLLPLPSRLRSELFPAKEHGERYKRISGSTDLCPRFDAA